MKKLKALTQKIGPSGKIYINFIRNEQKKKNNVKKKKRSMKLEQNFITT